jgi:adenine-specific DNA-methyltransferase
MSSQPQKTLALLTWPGRPAQPPAILAPTYLPDRTLPSDSWHNRLYASDNLPVLYHLLPEFEGKIDLIYIDPPFNTGNQFALQGNLEGHAYSDLHENGLAGYLSMMLPRLQVIHRLLSKAGTLYLHCDWRASSHLRLLLDEVFSPQNLRAEIIWHYQSGGRQKRCWSSKHDTIWMYSKSPTFTFNPDAVGTRRGAAPRNHMKQVTLADGKTAFTIRSAGRVYTYTEDDLITPSDVWTDIAHLQQKDPERTGYATQKPAKLLERIILASSNEGDLVADFFCGSGTTLEVAQRLNRRWIGADSGTASIDVCLQRLSSQLIHPPLVLYRPAP